ncbi:hypothetical protein LSAT2_012289 [Lamellibrachia satsuma]|nr:hypothetical protein LSAT2_012289 [Lamellibrachia satsuma]
MGGPVATLEGEGFDIVVGKWCVVEYECKPYPGINTQTEEQITCVLLGPTSFSAVANNKPRRRRTAWIDNVRQRTTRDSGQRETVDNVRQRTT